MKTKVGSLLVLLFVFAVAAFSTPAQAKSKSDVRTITGCLSKGDSADEFLLTGNNGSTWEVRSSEVALADHVGHTVTATGAVSNVTMHNMKEDAKDMAADSGVKKNDTEHGHMTVTSLKHVSDTCEK
jgi:ABC-type sugar transport system substrate-binding protein